MGLKVKDLNESKIQVEAIMKALSLCIHDHGVHEINENLMIELKTALTDYSTLLTLVIANTEVFK